MFTSAMKIKTGTRKSSAFAAFCRYARIVGLFLLLNLIWRNSGKDGYPASAEPGSVFYAGVLTTIMPFTVIYHAIINAASAWPFALATLAQVLVTKWDVAG